MQRSISSKVLVTLTPAFCGRPAIARNFFGSIFTCKASASFTALQRKGVDSRLLVFPDENHWVLKPKNSIQWYDEVFKWMGKHLQPAAAQ